jgi:hypothetical protein
LSPFAKYRQEEEQAVIYVIQAQTSRYLNNKNIQLLQFLVWIVLIIIQFVQESQFEKKSA